MFHNEAVIYYETSLVKSISTSIIELVFHFKVKCNIIILGL